ncbi:hypothetical protein MHI27_06065 [Paenibacillus sp. FSL H8-0261]|jgi:hypothetical protein|uniref:hypothetical protein n=1 Tax=Paenibacillus sp. FSL H8-0261 TaxID=2921381 RepID=UPI0032453E06
MNLSSSITYRRFLNDYYNTFINQYFSDLIDFLEEEDDHKFEQYLLENEISFEIKSRFPYHITAIENEMKFNSIELNDIENEYGAEVKVYNDAVKIIKVKLKAFILDSQAYYHLAEKII